MHMSVGTRAGWKRAPDPLELELEATVSLIWVLGAKLVLCRSSVCSSLLSHP